MKNILITGAAGFLGYNLVMDLQKNFNVTVTTHLNQVLPKEIPVIYLDLAGDFSALESAMARTRYHTVIHAAALADADYCENNADLAYRVNTEGTVTLAALSETHGAQMIFISTDLVYSTGQGPHGEAAAAPNLVYSRSKIEAERRVSKVHPRCITLRCALIYGPDNGVNSSYVRRMDTNIRNGKPLNLFTDQFRTPVWSGDISTVVSKILNDGILPGIYNLGGPDNLSRYDFGLIAADILGWDTDLIHPVKMADLTHLAGRPRDCSLDTSRLLEAITYKSTPVSDGLRVLKQLWQHQP